MSARQAKLNAMAEVSKQDEAARKAAREAKEQQQQPPEQA